jgi:transposase
VTLFSRLLPHAPLLHLDAWQMDHTARQLTLRVTSTQARVDGPVCRFPTQRVPSRSTRTVSDLPWGSWRVVRDLRVRTFFCAPGRCPRRIFTARLFPLVGSRRASMRMLARGSGR